MSNGKEMIRHSINLLEHPLWFQDERLAETTEEGMVWRDLDGYVYRSGYKVPVKTDVIFLLYLLLQSQKADYAQTITVSRYQIIHGCGLQRNSKWYARLEDSLERWKMVGIKFAGTFYDGKEYHSINFGVIDSWEIDEATKQLQVDLSPKFIKMMLGKGFFKYINFSEFKQLHSPLATRLYEILSKSFHGRDLWEIDAVKLAEKIPMKERYPAHIVPKIQTAISRINQCTESFFSLVTRSVTRGQTILSFRKMAKERFVQMPATIADATIGIPENPEVAVLIELLPVHLRTQRSILDMIVGFYEMRGAPFVARNIRYTNKHATENYRPYLLKALRGDYGFTMQEDEEAKRRVEEQATQKANEIILKQVEETRRRKLEVEAHKQAQAYITALPPDARADLEQEAIAGMEPNARAIVQRNGPGTKIILSLAMERIATRRQAEAKAQPNLPTLEAEQ